MSRVTNAVMRLILSVLGWALTFCQSRQGFLPNYRCPIYK